MSRTFRSRVQFGICALFLTVGTVGCAIGNRADVQLVRTISIGQEMIDLKKAVDQGALSQQEYLDLKAQLMEIADIEGVVELVDERSEEAED